MDFLKAILGEELYQQVADKIALYNGTPENENNQIKLANLGTGAYVSKDKYASLEATHNSKLAELEQANILINDLKNQNKGNEALQNQINAYGQQVQELQNELAKEKVNSAIKVALLGAKAQDIDYLTYKLNEEGAEFALDENGQVKGLDEKIEGLKIKFPTQFASGAITKVIENKLGKNENNPSGLTKADILKKPYGERVKLYNENPEAFNEIMKN